MSNTMYRLLTDAKCKACEGSGFRFIGHQMPTDEGVKWCYAYGICDCARLSINPILQTPLPSTPNAE